MLPVDSRREEMIQWTEELDEGHSPWVWVVLNHQVELEEPVPTQVVALELKSDSFLDQSCTRNPRPLRCQYHLLSF